MSRYHTASTMLSRAAAKTVRGHYESKLTKVIEPLRWRALDFAVLLLHRLVEEYRWAVVLAESEGDRTVQMTKTPWAAGPADPWSAHEIGTWGASDRAGIMREIARRRALTGSLERELDQIAKDVSRTESWLAKGMSILAKHIEEGEADRPDRGEKITDMIAPFFKGKAPGVRWGHAPLFKGNPDADLRTIEDQMRLYKHGPSRTAMRPLHISDENWKVAKLTGVSLLLIPSPFGPCGVLSRQSVFLFIIIALAPCPQDAVIADEPDHRAPRQPRCPSGSV